MRWLDRLLGRSGGYSDCSISELAVVDQRVAIEGQVEALSVLHDPISGEPAVVLDYRARKPGVAQRYFGIDERDRGITATQAVDFVLRDPTGAALIEVARGGDVDALHQRMHEEFGIGLDATVDRIAAGDRIRVRGRVRTVDDGSSPHRREPWTVVVMAEELELI